MPFKYALEMFCDYLGAGKAYMGKNFTYSAEYKWWLNKKANNLAMHPIILNFMNKAFLYLYLFQRKPNKEMLWRFYQSGIEDYKGTPHKGDE